MLLTAFVLTERRAREPITPLRMFADRNRSGTYLIMMSLAAAMFGMFFFIVLFVQNVLDYSPINSGLAFLPVTVMIVTAAGISSKLLPVLGPKPFLAAGAVFTGSGMAWLTALDPGSSYAGGVLGPMLLFGFGMGLVFVTATLTAVSGVAQHESGAASSLLNATQMVGGSLGLSILMTVFSTASRNEAERQLPSFLADSTPAQKEHFARTHELPPPWGHQVLAEGIATAFWAGVGLVGLAVLTAVFVVRVRKSDLEALSGAAGAGGPAA